MREARITTNIAHLSATRFSAVEFPIPPLAEQDRIVAAIEEQFSRVDAGLTALEKVQQNLKRVRAAVLQAAVTGRLLCRSSDSGSTTDALPDGWSWQPLERLITRLRNGIFVSRPVAEPVGPPILRISSVRPMALDITDVRYVPNPDQLKRADDFLLEVGDLLFTRYSGNPEYVGACAIVPPAPQRLLYPDKLIRVQVNQRLADPRFVAMAASAGHTRREIRARVKTTAGQTGISGSDLRTVPFPLPPLEVQRRIIEEVDKSLTSISALEDDVLSGFKRASSLRSSLLGAAFSGKLVPQDLSDEPASVLLERIATEHTPTSGQMRTPARKSDVRPRAIP
jgi:type I restriction enzyme S subunit